MRPIYKIQGFGKTPLLAPSAILKPINDIWIIMEDTTIYIHTTARNMAPLPRSQRDLHKVVAVEKTLANNEQVKT